MGSKLLHTALLVCLLAAPRLLVVKAQTKKLPAKDIPVHSKQAVPIESVVQFRDLTFWQQYKWSIVGAVVLSLLIVGLLLERSRKKAAARLLVESEERYRNVVETQTEMICRYLPDTTLTFVNDAYCRYFQKDRDKLIGSRFIDLIPAHAQDVTQQHIQSLLETRRTHVNEHEVFRPDGSLGWHQWIDHVISSDGLIELQGIGRDITERKALEDNLRLSEREFSTLVENSPDIICRLDRNLRCIYISPAFERVTGIPNERFIGKRLQEITLPGYDWKDFQACCEKAIESKKLVQRPFAYGDRNYWARVIPEFSPDGLVESVMAISEDVTDRIRSEQELTQLTVRLFNSQDEERRRIARELHDGTAQNLFAISINLAKLSQLSFSEDQEIRELIEECEALGEQSLKEIRTLSYLLHPPLLDQAGLVSALQWYVDGFSKRSGIYVQLYAEPIGRLPSDIEMALFRVVQEGLSNVRRHSACKTANIRLENRSGVIVLEIKDQGQGLSLVKNSPDSDALISPGVGIPGMKQRLRQLGGNLEIVSNERGTTVSAVVPIGNGVNHGTNTSG